MDFKKKMNIRMVLTLGLICLFSFSLGINANAEGEDEYPEDQYIIEHFNNEWVSRRECRVGSPADLDLRHDPGDLSVLRRQPFEKCIRRGEVSDRHRCIFGKLH